MVLKVLIFLLTTASAGWAEASLPRFDDFSNKEHYQGKVVRPLLATPEDKEFRTQLRAAAQQRPNFTGHFVVTTFGCGAQCVMGAALDAKTGRVLWFPFTICCWDVHSSSASEPVAFRLNSNLIMFTGSRNEKGNGTYYYTLDKDRFVLRHAAER